MVCLDLSNWQYPADGQALAAAGVDEIIIGAQIPSQSRQIIESCRAAGIQCRSDYAFLWDVETPKIRTQKAIDLAKQYALPLVWLDVEDGDLAPATVAGRQASVMECRRLVEGAGLECGIYTSGPYWIKEMGNTAAFKDLPLWYANWGVNDGKQAPIYNVDFGGWKVVAVHQFTSLYPINGGLDANYIMDESIFGEEPMGMTPEERKEFDELKETVRMINIESIILGPDLLGYSILESLRRNSDAINAHINSTTGAAGNTVSGTFVGTITGGE
jgi:GH25 family lysozyme M1 (1,4-beta-N-acetylmuramidase)